MLQVNPADFTKLSKVVRLFQEYFNFNLTKGDFWNVKYCNYFITRNSYVQGY